MAKSNWLPNRVDLSCGGRTAQLVGGERMSSAELSVLCRCQEVCAGLGRGAFLGKKETEVGRKAGERRASERMSRAELSVLCRLDGGEERRGSGYLSSAELSAVQMSGGVYRAWQEQARNGRRRRGEGRGSELIVVEW